MPDHSSDAIGRATRSRRVPRTDWRLGGGTVAGWREPLLAEALASLGAAVLVGTLVQTLWQSPWAPALATLVLWFGMLLPAVWALMKSRPAGLLRVRGLDVLYGLALGVILRMTQGWLELAVGGSGALPSYLLIDGRLPVERLVTDAAGVLIAPVIEEFFFRGVVLVVLYSVLRRSFGRVAASIAAVTVSTGLFVLVHAITNDPGVDGVLSLALLGLVCSLLVVLTGRLWGAVLVHVVYNATYVLLAIAGTFLS